MKTAIVTGATGFVGAQLVRELSSHGVTVFAICRPDSPNLHRISYLKNVKMIDGDLEHIESVFTKISPGTTIDAIYHIAWDGSEGNARFDFQRQISNISYCGKVADLAARMGCNKIIVSGTIYEKMRDTVFESGRVYPSSLYFITKDSAHHLLSQYCCHLGITLIWCQFLQPLGAEMRDTQLIPTVIQALLRGESPLLGPCSQPFDMISVQDLANGFYLAGISPLSQGSYYIGSGSPRLLRDYLSRVRDLIAPSVELKFGGRVDDGMQFDFLWFSLSKFSNLTGFTPQISFDKSILLLKQHYMSLER